MGGRSAVDRPVAIRVKDRVTRVDLLGVMLASLDDPTSFKRILLLSKSP